VSDIPMPGGMPGAGPSAGPSGGMGNITNPNEAALMSARGDIKPDMTVRDVLGKFGIDVDGPASQLTAFMQSQMKGRTLTGKMGMGAPAPQGAPQMAPQGGMASPAPQPGGMEGLMRNLRS
jgi:hypothetical protein